MMRRWRRLVMVGGEVGAAEAAWFLLVVFVTLVSSVEAYGLKCYVGLGNTSELKKQKVVECPEEKHYVCMKMYGGGMGDQVRRKCHLINSEDFEELLEKEAEKERMVSRGDSIGADPSCYESKDKGRKVNICLCSTDMCNAANDRGAAGAKLAFAAVTALLAIAA